MSSSTSSTFCALEGSHQVRQTTGSNSNNHHLGFWLATSMALLASGAGNTATPLCKEEGGKRDETTRNDDEVDKKILPMEKVMTILQSRLQKFRAQRFPKSSASDGIGWYPKVTVSKDTIEVPLPPHAPATEARVLAACLGTLQKEGVTCSFHTGLTMPDSTTLTFVMSGKSGSVLLNSRVHAVQSSLVLFKDQGFTEADLNAVVESYIAAWSAATEGPAGGIIGFADMLDAMRGELAGGNVSIRGADPSSSSSSSTMRGGGGTASDPANRLRKLGAEVFDKSRTESEKELDWTCLAGYDTTIQEEVMDTIVIALQHPEKYEAIARRTRERYESNRPRAVLFEGPPGTGKTLTARIIANMTDIPLVYVPVERVMSKWFGESENKLSKIFEACQDMGGCLIFIDEIDALATSRDNGNMHEATRRVLSVILQHIEGFKGNSRNVLIGATNRKQDLDAALLSRFDTSIRFDLPNTQARKAIYSRYAKHLSSKELEALSNESEGMSCRDIKEVCENTERRWASKLIKEEVSQVTPPSKEYLQAARARGTASYPMKHQNIVV